MTIDDALLIAYADGELDPLAARRVERAMAGDPVLAGRVAEHRALRERISRAFAPVGEEAAPDRLSTLLTDNVVALSPRRPPVTRWWPAGAVAAGLALAIGLATPWHQTPGTGDHASGMLETALDQRLASSDGDPRLLVSFLDRQGSYCRVFAGRALDGIACRDGSRWRLVRTAPGSENATGAGYRQAGSGDATLLGEAQAMMAGDPLDAAAEASARQRGWR
ncbi:MAG: anti-sigma factor [Sphingomonas phyllosphaerae]